MFISLTLPRFSDLRFSSYAETSTTPTQRAYYQQTNTVILLHVAVTRNKASFSKMHPFFGSRGD